MDYPHEDHVGPYILETVIGQGGFGVVFRARDTSGRIYALKLLHDWLTDDWFAFSRLLQEIRLLRHAKHAHIVELIGAGRDHRRLYLIEEYCAQGSLRQELRHVGHLPLAAAIETILPVVAACEYLHQRGVVHGDLKPDNILRTVTGAVKVSDLGVATSLARGVSAEPHTAATLGKSQSCLAGTRAYLAPEYEADAGEPTIARDVFALGITLHEILTGVRPARGQLMQGLIPILPSYVAGPTVRVHLERVLARCLALTPHARFNQVGELRAALEHLRPSYSESTL